MAGPPDDRDATRVLGSFRLSFVRRVERLGGAGGFSGSRLWRITSDLGTFALKAWPPGTHAEHIRFAHVVQQRAAALPFVPTLIPTNHGSTWTAATDRLWELATWMPGRADFRDGPSPAKMAAAGEILARLHLEWRVAEREPVPCPAVRRRLAVAREWQQLIDSGWRPNFTSARDEIDRLARRAWDLFTSLLPRLVCRLQPWEHRPVPVQPCLCDVWHDHILFTDDAVTGIIDFGSAKIDHVAVDLARWLGSTAGDDTALAKSGLCAYAAVRPLQPYETELVALLEWSGTVLGVGNWLRWLYRDGRTFEDRSTVARRLRDLVAQLETARPGEW